MTQILEPEKEISPLPLPEQPESQKGLEAGKTQAPVTELPRAQAHHIETYHDTELGEQVLLARSASGDPVVVHYLNSDTGYEMISSLVRANEDDAREAVIGQPPTMQGVIAGEALERSRAEGAGAKTLNNLLEHYHEDLLEIDPKSIHNPAIPERGEHFLVTPAVLVSLSEALHELGFQITALPSVGATAEKGMTQLVLVMAKETALNQEPKAPQPERFLDQSRGQELTGELTGLVAELRSRSKSLFEFMSPGEITRLESGTAELQAVLGSPAPTAEKLAPILSRLTTALESFGQVQVLHNFQDSETSLGKIHGFLSRLKALSGELGQSGVVSLLHDKFYRLGRAAEKATEQVYLHQRQLGPQEQQAA